MFALPFPSLILSCRPPAPPEWATCVWRREGERVGRVAGGSCSHTCFNVTQNEGENMPLIAQQGPTVMMKVMWLDSVPQKQQQHAKQLCVVGLLFSALAHSQWPECHKVFVPPRIANWFRHWRPADLDQVFFELCIIFMVASVCRRRLSPTVSKFTSPLIGGTWRRGRWKALIVPRAKCRVPCNLAIFQGQHTQLCLSFSPMW